MHKLSSMLQDILKTKTEEDSQIHQKSTFLEVVVTLVTLYKYTNICLNHVSTEAPGSELIMARTTKD